MRYHLTALLVVIAFAFIIPAQTEVTALGLGLTEVEMTALYGTPGDDILGKA